MKKYLLIFCFIFLYTAPVKANPDTGYSNISDASAPFSQAKFVPDISLIVDFSAAARNMNDERYGTLTVPGFIPAAGDEGMNAHNGFNFNYGELVIAAPVDPYFDLTAIFHLHQEEFEIEEAYIGAKLLPLGFNAKFGKFLSSFGRINPQHAHFRDFTDQPLILQGIFGGEGLNEKGAQLTWLVPADLYLLFGAELFQGENEASFGNEGFSDPDGAYRVKGTNRPGLYSGFIKTSIETGNVIFLAGVSCAAGKTLLNDGFDSDTGGEAIAADTRIFGGDVTLKYLIDSYRYVSLQAEYIQRNMNGSLYEYDPSSLPATRSDLEKIHSGMYAQLVLKPFLRWRLGGRYEMILRNDVRVDHTEQYSPANLVKYSAMLEYDPSEFSRFRVQLNHDASAYSAGGRETNNEVIIQCNLAIGAHGAHSL